MAIFILMSIYSSYFVFFSFEFYFLSYSNKIIVENLISKSAKQLKSAFPLLPNYEKNYFNCFYSNYFVLAVCILFSYEKLILLISTVF